MSFRSVAVAVTALALTASAVALAAVRPAPSTSFFYVESGSFSISLDTNETASKIAPGPVFPHHNQRPESGALAVCPASTPGAQVTEIHVGFPGATFKLTGHHYGFVRSYTQKRAQIVVVGRNQATALVTAKVRVTATVTGKSLIKGTVSIQAANCSLPASAYQATVFKPA